MAAMNQLPDKATSRRDFLFYITLFVVLALALLFFNPYSDTELSEGNYLVLSQAEALAGDIEIDEIARVDSNWMPVSLPFHWRNQFTDARAVWYRLDVSGEDLASLAPPVESSEEPSVSIYIWRLNQTADIWFNGRKIGSGGNTTEPMARHWNSPLYFPIPSDLIQPNNEILIKHFAQHGWGSMEAIVLGPEAALKPMYDRRYFIQHDVALGLFVFVLLTGGFCFTVWFNRRQEEEYLWFAIASAGLSFFCLNQFIRYLPFNDNLWRWLSNMTTDLWGCAIFIFMLRSLKLEKPFAEKVIFFYLLSGIPVYFYASFFQVFDINIYYHIGSLLIGVYGIFVCARHYLQTRIALAAFYSSVILLIFVAGVHDTVMQAVLNNGWLGTPSPGFQNHFNSLHFAAPLIFLFIAASLIKRFVDSMNKADYLNAELERRVSEAREELADNYKAIEAVLIKQSASEERERIFRDLHDDVGSKLLSLYYRLDKASDSILAKSALEDLRDIVSHKSLEGCSLREAERQWHQEAFERVRDAGIPLNWQCEGEFEGVELSELQRTQLRRMLREVLSNAILHSEGISQIMVAIVFEDNNLTISIANDGVAKPVAEWRSGRGISNLRVRARDLNGQISISDMTENWVQIVWTVPLETTEQEVDAT